MCNGNWTLSRSCEKVTQFAARSSTRLRTERENLHGDAKGKGTSGTNREAENTDAPVRGGLLRSSVEAGVMLAERRGWVIAVDLGQPVRRDEPLVQPKAAAFARWHEPDDARVSSPVL